MLKVNAISFGYTKKKTVLDNFNFSLKEVEHLCVMGESVCVKSTILNSI
jgi:ABC-type cobalamin/Fe3+-siderophores transport system ATPase subunit